MRTKEISDVNSEERGGRSMHMKHEYERPQDSDHEVDLDDDSMESCEKEYDTADEEGGYLGGSGDSSGSVRLQVSSDDSSHGSSEGCSEPEPEIPEILWKTAVSFGHARSDPSPQRELDPRHAPKVSGNSEVPRKRLLRC